MSKPKLRKKRKFPKRTKRAEKLAPSSDTVEQSQSRQVENHSHNTLIVKWLRAGATNIEIAGYLKAEGLISQTIKTYAAYIAAYKRRHYDFIFKRDVEAAVGISGDDYDFDGIVVEEGPSLDADVELQKILKFQKRRLAIGHKMEQTTGMINPDLHRDVKVTMEIAERIHGGGRSAGGGKAKQNSAATTPDADAALTTLKQNEGSHDRLVTLSGELVKAMQRKVELARDKEVKAQA